MKMLKATDVAQMLGFSRATFYQMLSDGRFPKGMKFGNNTRWPDFVAEAYTIKFWRLDLPMPDKLTDSTEKEIDECVEKAHQSSTIFLARA